MPLIRKGWAMSQGRWGGQVRTSRVGRKGREEKGTEIYQIQKTEKKHKPSSSSYNP